MEEQLKIILSKIANGIGNMDSKTSITEFAKAGGCDSEEIEILENAMDDVYSGRVC